MEDRITRLEQRVTDLEFQVRMNQRFLEHVLNAMGEKQLHDMDSGRQDRVRQPLRHRNAGMGL